ncbi:annulin-like protein, partial [Leptotrombidium deliense]
MWMKRPDLSNNAWQYGGWQILDGTPQQRSYETNDNLYQLGPAPLVAVKNSK